MKFGMTQVLSPRIWELMNVLFNEAGMGLRKYLCPSAPLIKGHAF